MAVRQDASTGQLVDDGQAAPIGQQLVVNGKPAMELKIFSPFRIYYDDTAFSISAENATGAFDILPKHHNFISLLNSCELLINAPNGSKRIRISGGLMHVQADRVRVFLDV